MIRSAFLASGYWGNAALTARRFREDANGNHLYFTGDIGRLTDSGELTLVGRVDDQVKIRGVSVHLGAVEDVILRQPGISGAMVEIDWGGAGPSLVAHVVGEPSGADDRQIQVAIFDALPAAAVPAIRRVERLPVTAAGKLDRSGRG